DLWRRVFQADAYWEPLRHPHPVERALHVGDRAGEVDSILIEHAPANAVGHSTDGQTAIDHRISGYAIAGTDPREIRLAQIGGNEPLFGIDESEERLPGSDEFSCGYGESDDQPVVCRAYGGVVEIPSG